MVNIDLQTKETEVTCVRSELYIHERRPGKLPVPPPRRRQKLKRIASKAADSNNNGIVKDMKAFVITGVIDPRTKQQLSIFQALSNGVLDQINGIYRNPDTGETMTIPEAIQRGLILVDYRENLTNGHAEGEGFAPMRNRMEIMSYPVEGVIDPKTGEFIGVKEAILAGIIDPRTGKYTNPLTGEQMSILEAVQNGYIVADSTMLDEITEENGMFTSVDFSDVSYEVYSVIDPATGEELSLKRAIQDGIIDPGNSLYRNPNTGETMAISDAIKQGLIKGRPVESSSGGSADNLLTFKQLHIKKQKFIPGGADIHDGMDEIDGRNDPNNKLVEKLRSKHDVSVPLTKNSGKREISLEEAMSQGLVNIAKNEFKLPSGETISIEEALAKRAVSPTAAKQILDIYKDNSIGKLIDEGKYDPETGLVTDPNTGHTLSLQAAIAQRIIDPNMVFLYDNSSGKVMNLATAIENGLFNPETGKFRDPKTGEELTLSEAVLRGLIQPYIEPDQITDMCDTLQNIEKVLDPRLKCVISPYTDKAISLEEAVINGVIDLKQGQVKNLVTGEVMTIAEAIKAEKMDPKLALQFLEGLDKLSLKENQKKGIIDLESGMIYDTNTGERLPMQDAIDNGSFSPNSVMLVDNETGNIISLGALIEAGRFDPKTGLYKDLNTGERMSLAEAIKRGLLDPEIVPERFADTSATLRDLIDNNRVNPRNTNFIAPNNQKMSLRDALANGFLTMNSKVKVDPQTGCVSLASDEAVVQSLVDIKVGTTAFVIRIFLSVLFFLFP